MEFDTKPPAGQVTAALQGQQAGGMIKCYYATW